MIRDFLYRAVVVVIIMGSVAGCALALRLYQR